RIAPDPHGVLADDAVGEAAVRRDGGAVQQGVRIVLGDLVAADVGGQRVQQLTAAGLDSRRARVALPLEVEERRQGAPLVEARERPEQAASLEVGEPLKALLYALGE